MRRETSNALRFAFEECLPPILRDSRAFRWLARLAWGGHVDALSRFRSRAAELSFEEYEALYRRHPRVHAATDNSRRCVARIIGDTLGETVLDVGCGTGFLLRALAAARPWRRLAGVDFVRPDGLDTDGIEFRLGRIESLPFEDAAFDTVLCTHVIEHILDFRQAIAELRRVCARRLIVVVPCEREGLTSFNPHFNFFPYPHSFLRAMIPLPKRFECRLIGRDIYYMEDCGAAVAAVPRISMAA